MGVKEKTIRLQDNDDMELVVQYPDGTRVRIQLRRTGDTIHTTCTQPAESSGQKTATAPEPPQPRCHRIKVYKKVQDKPKYLGCMAGHGCVNKRRIHQEHFATRDEEEWLKFSSLVLQLRRDNEEYFFVPDPLPPGQGMFQ